MGLAASRIKIVNVTDAENAAGRQTDNGNTIDLDENEFHAEPNPDSPWRGGNN